MFSLLPASNSVFTINESLNELNQLLELANNRESYQNLLEGDLKDRLLSLGYFTLAKRGSRLADETPFAELVKLAKKFKRCQRLIGIDAGRYVALAEQTKKTIAHINDLIDSNDISEEVRLELIKKANQLELFHDEIEEAMSLYLNNHEIAPGVAKKGLLFYFMQELNRVLRKIDNNENVLFETGETDVKKRLVEGLFIASDLPTDLLTKEDYPASFQAYLNRNITPDLPEQFVNAAQNAIEMVAGTPGQIGDTWDAFKRVLNVYHDSKAVTEQRAFNRLAVADGEKFDRYGTAEALMALPDDELKEKEEKRKEKGKEKVKQDWQEEAFLLKSLNSSQFEELLSIKPDPSFSQLTEMPEAMEEFKAANPKLALELELLDQSALQMLGLLCKRLDDAKGSLFYSLEEMNALKELQNYMQDPYRDQSIANVKKMQGIFRIKVAHEKNEINIKDLNGQGESDIFAKALSAHPELEEKIKKIKENWQRRKTYANLSAASLEELCGRIDNLEAYLNNMRNTFGIDEAFSLVQGWGMSVHLYFAGITQEQRITMCQHLRDFHECLALERRLVITAMAERLALLSPSQAGKEEFDADPLYATLQELTECGLNPSQLKTILMPKKITIPQIDQYKKYIEKYADKDQKAILEHLDSIIEEKKTTYEEKEKEVSREESAEEFEMIREKVEIEKEYSKEMDEFIKTTSNELDEMEAGFDFVLEGSEDAFVIEQARACFSDEINQQLFIEYVKARKQDESRYRHAKVVSQAHDQFTQSSLNISLPFPTFFEEIRREKTALDATSQDSVKTANILADDGGEVAKAVENNLMRYCHMACIEIEANNRYQDHAVKYAFMNFAKRFMTNQDLNPAFIEVKDLAKAVEDYAHDLYVDMMLNGNFTKDIVLQYQSTFLVSAYEILSQQEKMDVGLALLKSELNIYCDTFTYQLNVDLGDPALSEEVKHLAKENIVKQCLTSRDEWYSYLQSAKLEVYVNHQTENIDASIRDNVRQVAKVNIEKADHFYNKVDSWADEVKRAEQCILLRNNLIDKLTEQCVRIDSSRSFKRGSQKKVDEIVRLMGEIAQINNYDELCRVEMSLEKNKILIKPRNLLGFSIFDSTIIKELKANRLTNHLGMQGRRS